MSQEQNKPPPFWVLFVFVIVPIVLLAAATTPGIVAILDWASPVDRPVVKQMAGGTWVQQLVDGTWSEVYANSGDKSEVSGGTLK